MAQPIPFVFTGKTLTFLYEGKTTIIDQSSAQWAAVTDALKKADWDNVAKLANLRTVVTLATNGRVRILDDGTVYLDDKLVNDALTTRMVEMIGEGFTDVKPYMNLLERIDANPSESAKAEFYLFLEACNLPVTSDGHFLGYKIVSPDYLDLYTKKLDNSVGKTVTMERANVDSDRNVTCSHGLHVCSEAYLPHYGSESDGDRVVVVKVDPADVVSIPSDYKNAKMRVCRYVVVDELKNWQERLKQFFTTSYGSSETTNDSSSFDSTIDEEEDDEDEWDDESYDDHSVNDEDDEESNGTLDKILDTLTTEQMTNPAVSNLIGAMANAIDEVESIAAEHGITADKVRQIRKVRAMGKEGFNKQAIADTTGMSRRQVGRILSGENWSEIE
jgi:hypothetical protein